MESILQEPQNNNTSNLWSLLIFTIRTLLGLCLGIIFSSIGQEIIGYGTFSTIFITLTSVFLVIRFTKGWAMTNVLILILFIFLLLMVLNTYISIAPGE